MPIQFDPKEGWKIIKPTKEEQAALLLTGKMVIVEGLAGQYTNDKYKKWLVNSPNKNFFNA